MQRLLAVTPSGLWFAAAIAVVAAFLVLRRPMAYAGVPPLYGGEIALLVFSVLFLRPRSVREFLGTPVGALAAAYTLLPIPYVLAEYEEAGLDAVMYASIAYYGVFLYFGYAIVSSRDRQDRFIRLLYYAILASSLHFILTKSTGLAEQCGITVNGIPLLGNNDSCYIYYALGIGYVAVYARELGAAKSLALLFASAAGHAIQSQRGSLLGILGVLAVLAWYRRLWWGWANRYLALALALGAAAALASEVLSPRDTMAEKVEEQVGLFEATVGDSSRLGRGYGTKDHRLRMWREVVDETVATDPLLGQGFREPLVDAAFRNPHNSFVSVFGRMGLVGLALALGIYIGFPVHVARRLGRVQDRGLQRHMLFYLCFAPAFLGAALFGPTLAAPYSALVCNFIYGAGLRCCQLACRAPVAGAEPEEGAPWPQ